MGKRRSHDQCLLMAVNQGHVKAVKSILKEYKYNKNQTGSDNSYSFKKLLLFRALSRIKRRNDCYHKISELLLKRWNMITCSKCASQTFVPSPFFRSLGHVKDTVLKLLHKKKCRTSIGVEMLLNVKRFKIPKHCYKFTITYKSKDVVVRFLFKYSSCETLRELGDSSLCCKPVFYFGLQAQTRG